MEPPAAGYRGHPPRGSAGRLGAARRWPAAAPTTLYQAAAAVVCAVAVFTTSRAACSSGSV